MIFSIVMLGLLSTTIVPVHAFSIPPNPVHDDYHFEVYGPHIKGILCRVYSDTASEWTDMANGTIDVTDSALDAAHTALWSTSNGPITEQSYGGEAGFYLIDINNDPSSETGDNPAAGINRLPLREAIAYCVNRSYVVSFTGGTAVPIYTPVPNYMGGYINSNISPGGSLSALTYGGYTGDLAAAEAELYGNGYYLDNGTGVRIDPYTGEDLVPLEFWGRREDRNLLAVNLVNNLMNIGIPVNAHLGMTRSQCTGPVFTVPGNNFNLYTGGWILIGPDPDYLYDLYDSASWYAGTPPNYDHINYSALDADLAGLKTAPNMSVALPACMDAQYQFALNCAAVPVFCYSGIKAYKNVPSETSTGMGSVGSDPTGLWKHFVNYAGVGVSSWWSSLDAQVYGSLYPNLNMTYGFSSTCSIFNIIYADSFWDLEVLDRIYDGGWARDPYTLLWTVPQLFQNYSVGTWIDPVTNQVKSSVAITLRPDVMWQDGVPLTVADVIYTLGNGPGSINYDLLAKGLAPAWWYPTVKYMQSVYQVDDYNVKILLKVQSVWAIGWVIGSLVVPKHVWKPIVDASNSTNQLISGRQPDPDIVGTGPFIWLSGNGLSAGDNVVLIANAPGTVVDHTGSGGHLYTGPGYYQYSPVMVQVSDLVSKIIVPNGTTQKVVPVTILLKNLWLDGNLEVNKYVYWDTSNSTSTLLPGYPVDKTLAPVAFPVPNEPPATPYPMGYSDLETLYFNMTVATTYYLKVAVHVKGPSTLNYTEPYGGVYENTTLAYVSYAVSNPWLSQWINVTVPIQLTIPLSCSTHVVCSPSPVVVGSPVTCAATVSGVNPTGTVTWTTSSSTGNFSSYLCALSSGSCSTTYTDSCPGSVSISACYSGDPNNLPSSGSSTLVVISNGSVYYSQNFSSVQAAIEAAIPGSNVIVAAGMYYGNLVLNKTLTIIGERDTPQWGGGGSGIYLTVLSGASGSNVTGFQITNYDEGILVYAGNCRIYGNSMSSMGRAGIVLEGSSATGNVVYDNSFQNTPTPINLTSSAGGNTVYDNIINSQATVTLIVGANSNTVYQNIISASSIVLNMTNSQGNTVYHNSFLASVQVVAAGTNTWDNGYPSGGNYWNDYRTKYPNAAEIDSSGIWNTSYIIDSSNKDNYPLMKPYGLAAGHDVAVASVVTAETVILMGLTCSVTVCIFNKGQYTETFQVTAYANAIIIGTQQVNNMGPTSQVTLMFAWNTASLPDGGYTVSAHVTLAPTETSTADNTFIGGTVQITSGGGGGRTPYMD
jgi:parallel beta-helix repeat protein